MGGVKLADKKKVPCLFPLDDGRRCYECYACQGDVMWTQHGRELEARVKELEEALTLVSDTAIDDPRAWSSAKLIPRGAWEFARSVLSKEDE